MPGTNSRQKSNIQPCTSYWCLKEKLHFVNIHSSIIDRSLHLKAHDSGHTFIQVLSGANCSASITLEFL